MSDENQPNEVVESQLKPEGSSVEPIPAPVAETPVTSVTDAGQPTVEAMDTPVAAAAESTPPSPTVVSIAELEASKPTTGDKVGEFFSGLGAFFQGRRWLIGVLSLIHI